MHISPANTVSYRRFLFSAADCFLDGNVAPERDINYFIQVPQNINNALSEFYTLLADLTQSEEKLWQQVYHRTRSEIQSFTANQDFEHRVAFNLPENELNDLIRMLDRFCRRKGLRRAEAFRLTAYNRAGLLAVSYIRQNGQIICINFYRVNTQRASNLYSFHRRHELGELFNGTHMGRAHRALHWLDMLELKRLNVPCYDFCGWYAGNSDQNLLNINAFKEQFTQHRVKEYSGVIYNNTLLKTLLRLR